MKTTKRGKAKPMPKIEQKDGCFQLVPPKGYYLEKLVAGWSLGEQSTGINFELVSRRSDR